MKRHSISDAIDIAIARGDLDEAVAGLSDKIVTLRQVARGAIGALRHCNGEGVNDEGESRSKEVEGDPKRRKEDEAPNVLTRYVHAQRTAKYKIVNIRRGEFIMASKEIVGRANCKGGEIAESTAGARHWARHETLTIAYK